MTRKEILEKNWKDFRLSTGLEYEPMSDKAYEFMENAMEQYAELRLGAVSGSLPYSIYEEELNKIKQLPQTQTSLLKQCEILRIFANKLGLYDAADFLRNSS